MAVLPSVREVPQTAPGAAAPPAAPARGWGGVRGAVEAAATGKLREQDVLAAIERLPSLPSVVMAVMREVRSETARLGRIEEQLGQDLVLSAKVLKMANSPFFALREPVGSIGHAVAVLGLNSMRSVVLASATSDLFRIDLSAYGYAGEGLWANSLTVATLARRIARLRGDDAGAAEDIFVGGLLRDLGMVVLAPFLAGRSLPPAAGLVASEAALTGFSHTGVGRLLAERWRLPGELAAMIAGHHDPIGGDGRRGLAAVALAERLTAMHGIGLAADHPYPVDVPNALVAAAGLDLPSLRMFLDEVPALIAQARLEQA